MTAATVVAAAHEAATAATVEAFMMCFAVGSMPIVAMEVVEVVMDVDVLAAIGVAAMVAVAGIEVMIDRAIAAGPAVIPGTGAEKQPAVEPLGTIVAVGGALVGGVAIVAVGAAGSWSTDVDTEGDLSRGAGWCSEGKTHSRSCGEKSVAHRTSLHLKHLAL